MKRYYSVVTKYYFDGDISAFFNKSCLLDECPTSTKIEKADYYLYIDWFGSLDEIERYINNLKNAFGMKFVS